MTKTEIDKLNFLDRLGFTESEKARLFEAAKGNLAVACKLGELVQHFKFLDLMRRFSNDQD